ncbi:MAG: aldo/keto reductase [Hyphomicrobiaceae bacterium]
MPLRILGGSGTRVSSLCLGTMMFGDTCDEATASRIVGHALDHGINFIDTANQYAGGRSEEITGRLIKANRTQWILASKVGNPAGLGRNNNGLSRSNICNAVDASLQRLGTDYIDLHYVHLYDPDTKWEHVVDTYGVLIRQGKIREWGVSNVRGWHIAHIANLCDRAGVPRPAAVQPYYNLMNRMPEVEVIPAARAFGLGVVSYSPIARGVLSGKYQLNVTPAADSRAARADKRMMETEWRPESLDIAAKLKAHAESRGTTLIHWAVAWVLNNQAISAAIAGPRTFEQWSDYLGAFNYKWDAADEAIANSLVAPGHASTPGYTDPKYPIEGRFPKIG